MKVPHARTKSTRKKDERSTDNAPLWKSVVFKEATGIPMKGRSSLYLSRDRIFVEASEMPAFVPGNGPYVRR